MIVDRLKEEEEEEERERRRRRKREREKRAWESKGANHIRNIYTERNNHIISYIQSFKLCNATHYNPYIDICDTFIHFA